MTNHQRSALMGIAALVLLVFLLPAGLSAHNVSKRDAAFVESNQGAAIAPFVYLGAKHMVTGYDHLLFLVGVIFLLRSLRQVAGYVTLFALAHSLTLISFVLLSLRVNETAIDALIALSVVYK